MLKLALIENLRRLAAETLASRRARLAADAYVSRLEREAGDTKRPLPSGLDSASVVQLLHRVRSVMERGSSPMAGVRKISSILGAMFRESARCQ
jgi:cyclic beta-1,2-glucan synthetase